MIFKKIIEIKDLVLVNNNDEMIEDTIYHDDSDL
jgi:hypothetical protein